MHARKKHFSSRDRDREEGATVQAVDSLQPEVLIGKFNKNTGTVTLARSKA